MSDKQKILEELARVKAQFQLRAIQAAMGIPQTATTQEQARKGK